MFLLHDVLKVAYNHILGRLSIHYIKHGGRLINLDYISFKLSAAWVLVYCSHARVSVGSINDCLVRLLDLDGKHFNLLSADWRGYCLGLLLVLLR